VEIAPITDVSLLSGASVESAVPIGTFFDPRIAGGQFSSGMFSGATCPQSWQHHFDVDECFIDARHVDE
jgi:hypothetical protein